ncbi:response regulator [Flavobacterium wongokense]|uniref:response regulator n=1 Tax=Flavobacterium wongokense TaxID=2910674 RepID=UPI001F3D8F87|nr:response regulator [Flavobacterium sp. WG47]MCF6130883.1 response regulator [Flavobacterium sp. WG47]
MEPLHPLRIMVADDDDDDRELFREIFERDERFTLMGCLESGMEVLNEISRKKNIPDVLLVDMYMPFFTGVDLVKALAELDAAPTLYKFVISTTTNIAENESQLDSPYIVFLKKPVTMQEINALPGVILGYMQHRLEKVG